MDRTALSSALAEIALLLSLKGENPFKVRAFENAASTLGSLPDLEQLLARGDLPVIPGIGKGILEVVDELRRSGRSSLADSLRAEFPSSLREVMRVPGLGPKKVAALWRQLGVATLGELEYAIAENRLVALEGFGRKTQEKIATGLAFLKSNSGRWRLPEALARAESARQRLLGEAAVAGISRVEIAGDLRRSLEVVSEIVLAVACERPALLVPIPDEPGLPPIRIVAENAGRFGQTWLYATGSESHLAELSSRSPGGILPEAPTEEEIYSRLGLTFVPPELREGRGEVVAASMGASFPLVDAGSLLGLFHLHTTYSDGKATLLQTFERVAALGYSYAGITDHSPAASYAGGLSKERVEEQWAEIESLRPKFPGLTLLRGTEADILPDGTLDYGDDFLARFDFVIASIHSAFHLSEREQTARILRAVRNPRVTLLGHATGRLLLARSGFQADLDAVLSAAGESGCGVEINASPFRLDLDWRWGEKARAAGVFTSINPDAHDLPALENVRFGAGIARKAGFAPDQVLNALPADEVVEKLALMRARS